MSHIRNTYLHRILTAQEEIRVELQYCKMFNVSDFSDEEYARAIKLEVWCSRFSSSDEFTRLVLKDSADEVVATRVIRGY